MDYAEYKGIDITSTDIARQWDQRLYKLYGADDATAPFCPTWPRGFARWGKKVVVAKCAPD